MISFHVMIVMLLELETQITDFANYITVACLIIYCVMVNFLQATLLPAETNKIMNMTDMIFISFKSIKCGNKLFWVRSPIIFRISSKVILNFRSPIFNAVFTSEFWSVLSRFPGVSGGISGFLSFRYFPLFVGWR